MMKKSKFQSGVSGKGKAIAGVAMTLAAAAVLTMAPMSQALAWGYSTKQISNSNVGPGWVHIKVTGHASSIQEARDFAAKGVGKCFGFMKYKAYDDKRTWHNGHWFNAIVEEDCADITRGI